MTTKRGVLGLLGETALTMPFVLCAALAANERAKYVLSLLQMAAAHADRPETAPATLSADREACGIADRTPLRYGETLHEMIGAEAARHHAALVLQLARGVEGALEGGGAPRRGRAVEHREAQYHRSGTAKAGTSSHGRRDTRIVPGSVTKTRSGEPSAEASSRLTGAAGAKRPSH